MDDTTVFKSEYLRWRGDKVTKRLVKDIFQKREMLKEGWAEDRVGNERQHAIEVGKCQAMRDIVEYIMADFDFVDDSSKEDSKEND